MAGGINVLEITMTTPNAVGLIEDCIKKYGDSVIVRAGTVADLESVEKCFDADVKFIFSPNFDQSTV